jgi:hypothetical protein
LENLKIRIIILSILSKSKTKNNKMREKHGLRQPRWLSITTEDMLHNVFPSSMPQLLIPRTMTLSSLQGVVIIKTSKWQLLAPVLGLFLGLALVLLASHGSIEGEFFLSAHAGRKLQVDPRDGEQSKRPLKVLYTITSLAEYNTGTRATIKGSDRLKGTMIPIVSEGVQSMLDMGYQVDVFIVAHYILRPERLKLIRESLPEIVKLNYWDDATRELLTKAPTFGSP